MLQTELLPRCGEIAPVGQVVHENGKALLQAVLEVRDAGPRVPWAALGSIPEQHPYGARGMGGSRESDDMGSICCLLCGRASVARLPAASWITLQKSSLP